MGKKIYIAGHRGLVGSALVRNARKKGYENLILKRRQELDLCNKDDVFSFFEQERPQWVFQAAGKVGGIYANNTYPVDFLLNNLKIQNNVIEAAYKYGVEKLMFLGSSCIYPKHAEQPLKEEALLSGKLEPTNEPYAIAKIAGIKLCNAYNKQYNMNFLSVMPCNLYGINDNYHMEDAHVLPMLIRRFHEAKEQGSVNVTVWGTGSPLREFMCSDDLADAAFYLMENKEAKDIEEFINIGTAKEITIKDLAELIKLTVGFKGTIDFDKTKPDGMMRKVLDISRMKQLGWEAKINLEDGLMVAYEDFTRNRELRK